MKVIDHYTESRNLHEYFKQTNNFIFREMVKEEWSMHNIETRFFKRHKKGITANHLSASYIVPCIVTGSLVYIERSNIEIFVFRFIKVQIFRSSRAYIQNRMTSCTGRI